MLSALRNIYQVYCGPYPWKFVQLVGIWLLSSILQSTRLRFGSHSRCHIHQIKFTDSRIGEYINITRRNRLRIIKGIRQGFTSRNSIQINTTIKVIRHRTSDNNLVYKRIVFTR